MATKNIVPNADSEGGIGTSSKYWATGFIDAITTTGNLVIGGNTGIGDPSPSQKLVVQGDWNQSATNNNQMYIQGSTNSNMQLRLGYDTTGDHGYIQALLNGTGGKELHLNTSGGAVVVGDSGTIGCASDTDLLTLASASLTVAGVIKQSGATSLLTLNDSNSDSSGSTNIFQMTDYANNVLFKIAQISGGLNAEINQVVNGSLAFKTNNTAALTLDASQNATFAGNISAKEMATIIVSDISTGENRGLKLENTGGGGKTWNVTPGLTGSNNATFTIRNATDNINALTIDAAGNTSINAGNLVIGTAGKGIDFSAETPSGSGTASALLDDYEEGTFTPAFTGVNTSGTARGFYTKIGDTVHAHATITSVSVSDGNQVIISLPFTRIGYAGGAHNGGGSVGYTTLTVDELAVAPSNDAASVVLYKDTPSAAVTRTDMSGKRIDFSITYQTAT